MSRPGKDLSRQFLLRKAYMHELDMHNANSANELSNNKDPDGDPELNEFLPLRHVKMEDSGHVTIKNELLAILNELRFITHKIKEDDEGNDEINDWKFAAMVIDRFCAWLFSLCMGVATIRKVFCEWIPWGLRMSRPGKDLSREALLRIARMRELEARTPPSVSLISNVKDTDNAIPLNEFPALRSVKLEEGGLLTIRNELLAILNELRFITHKIKEDNEQGQDVNDWKFAAMVIDRIFAWFFSFAMTIATVAIFFSSPNILK